MRIGHSRSPWSPTLELRPTQWQCTFFMYWLHWTLPDVIRFPITHVLITDWKLESNHSTWTRIKRPFPLFSMWTANLWNSGIDYLPHENMKMQTKATRKKDTLKEITSTFRLHWCVGAIQSTDRQRLLHSIECNLCIIEYTDWIPHHLRIKGRMYPKIGWNVVICVRLTVSRTWQINRFRPIEMSLKKYCGTL